MVSPLAQRMRELAADQPTAVAVVLCQHADAFEAAIAQLDGTKENSKRMLGCWARARRALCDVTGEELVDTGPAVRLVGVLKAFSKRGRTT